ncbi:MAG: hypothetical protein DRH21_02310 [Deltaproteobacteria bacterium]|nr:MAG: hypothetical protein DRH21_02310 [Deltaproteobacteria bacterium]
MKLGFRISRASEMPLSVYTHMENASKESYEEIIKNENLEEEMDHYVTEWHMFERGKFEENIYDVPHYALVVLGAYGHGLIRNIFLGSKMEKIQSIITNNLLIAGPNYALTR